MRIDVGAEKTLPVTGINEVEEEDEGELPWRWWFLMVS
jgi:hypothetical protein